MTCPSIAARPASQARHRQHLASATSTCHPVEACQIGERHAPEFRVDFCNVGNVASDSNPDSRNTDSYFGQITDVRSQQRRIQFSLHYSF